MTPKVSEPEPWLRGPLADVHPLVMPVYFSYAQVREDLQKHVAHLSPEQIWRPVNGASVGFHLQHMAGSVDRLTTYLMGQQLSREQLLALREESSGHRTAAELVAQVEGALHASEVRLKDLDPSSLYEKRVVGRKALPTTVIGLIVHLAEHTQRHLGQVITLSKTLQPPGT